MAARFLAGVSAGLLWALLAGYAARMVPEHLKGRAIAVAMVGIPLALSLGVPSGTLLGAIMGWRACFGIMSVMTLGLVAWVLASVPDFAGQPASQQLPLARVFTLPGVRTVLFVTLAYVLAHNILYTYIAPFLREANAAGAAGSCPAGIWRGIAGRHLDHGCPDRQVAAGADAGEHSAVRACGAGARRGGRVRRRHLQCRRDLGRGLRRGLDAVPDGDRENRRAVR